MQTRVTVSFVNGPKEVGGAYGSIKASDGNYYSVKREDLPLFTKGQTYHINYIENAKNGKVFRNYVSMADGAQPAAAPQPIAASLPQQTYQEPPNTAAQTPVLVRDTNYYAPVLHADPKERGMFIMGVVGRAMGSGRFDHSDILPLADGASRAYDIIFNGASRD